MEHPEPSKHWSQMYVAKWEQDIQARYISLDSPPPLPRCEYRVSSGVTMEGAISVRELSGISRFLCSNNRTSSGNITHVSLEHLIKLQKMGFYRAAIYGQDLMGFALSIPLPIKINGFSRESVNITKSVKKLIAGRKGVTVHGCTTFLCVSAKYRGTGLGMQLIKSIISEGHNRGILSDYHLVAQKHTANPVPIKMWFRPINPRLARKTGFIFRTPTSTIRGRRTYRSKSAFRSKYYLDTRDPILLKAENVGALFDDILRLMSKHVYSYHPTLDHFKKYINVYDTYAVLGREGGNLLSVFSFHHSEVTIGSNTCGTTIMILAAGNPDICLKQAVNMCDDIAVLYLYQVGTVSKSHLEGVNALSTPGYQYFEMYNNGMQLYPGDLCVPLV